MPTQDFITQITALDSRFSVVSNPNYKELLNIHFEGKNYDLPVLPAAEIKAEADPKYFFTFINGQTAPYNDQATVLRKLKEFLGNLEEIKKIYED